MGLQRGGLRGTGDSSDPVPEWYTDVSVIANELGLPEYDDVANAPQTQGRLVYATGNGTSAEGIYKHDGSSYAQVGGSGALSDSGTDTDGGDDYQLPNAADNIDLQGSGGLRNADVVDTDDASIGNVTIRQSDAGSVSIHEGELVTVSGNSWQTIFDVTNTTDVIGGNVFGSQATRFRVTWDDGTTDIFFTEAQKRGADRQGDLFSVLSIPSIKDASKLEFWNDATGSSDYGWMVLTI